MHDTLSSASGARATGRQRHQVWRTLFRRQAARLPGAMSRAWLEGLRRSGLPPDAAPRHAEVSRRLWNERGWRIETVAGLLPVEDFFQLLRERRFPATDWLRSQQDLAYTPAPDAFHDLFGHVPQLYVPELSGFTEALGEAARGRGCEELLGLERLYWHTLEFGLVRERGGLRAIGAGLASSSAELQRALGSPEVWRRPLGPWVRATGFDAEHQQEHYAVAEELGSLIDQLTSCGAA